MSTLNAKRLLKYLFSLRAHCFYYIFLVNRLFFSDYWFFFFHSRAARRILLYYPFHEFLKKCFAFILSSFKRSFLAKTCPIGIRLRSSLLSCICFSTLRLASSYHLATSPTKPSHFRIEISERRRRVLQVTHGNPNSAPKLHKKKWEDFQESRKSPSTNSVNSATSTGDES